MNSTPKTLEQAIINGLSQPQGNTTHNIHSHVLDYLRQQFGILYLSVSPDHACTECGASQPETFNLIITLAKKIGVEL